MVLSNKKLKTQAKQTLISHLSKPQSDPTLPKKSLRDLINSVVPKPILSKREKLRTTRLATPKPRPQPTPVVSNDITQGNEGGEGDVGVVKKVRKPRIGKKRKREDGEVGEDEGDTKEARKERKMREKERRLKLKKKMNKIKYYKNKRTKKKMEAGEVEVVAPVVKKEEAIAVDGVIESQENVDMSIKVYVGGIPYYSTEDDIRSFFESCGTITEIDCMTFPDTGKFRGIAMIIFKTEAAAKRALALDGADMGGLFLKVQPYKATKMQKASDFAPKLEEGYNRVYMGNLSWDITEDDLRKFFSDCKISSIRFGEDKEKKVFKGYAHVNFSDVVSATVALTLDQKILCGRPVKISAAVKKDANTRNPISSSSNKEDQKSGINSKDVGKNMRRKCYECGNASHRSSDCPTKKELVSSSVISAKEDKDRSAPVSLHETSVVNISESMSTEVSGKMKRRKCYECGTAGHLSTDCPNKKKLTLSFVNEAREYEDYITGSSVYEALYSGADVSETLNTAVTGKMKRRKCYECGTAGHLSTDCPNKKEPFSSSEIKVSRNSLPVLNLVSKATETASIDMHTNLSSSLVNEDANMPLTGKMKRRKCYECGIPGHLSSACPNKKVVDPGSF